MSNANQVESRNVMISNVELHWAKLDKAVPNFQGDADQWEVQVRVPKKRREELEEFGKVKEEDGGKTISKNFYKKTTKADGEPSQRVKVVDIYGDAVDPKTIGNGTKANIRLLARPFQIKNPKTGKVTKEGTTTILMAIQITELVKYERQGGDMNDFDYKEKPAGGNKKVVEDDDIPF
jgi:hypothetical protein